MQWWILWQTTCMRRGRLAHSWTKSMAGRQESTDAMSLMVKSYKQTTTTALVPADDTNARKTRVGALRRHGRGGKEKMEQFAIAEDSDNAWRLRHV